MASDNANAIPENNNNDPIMGTVLGFYLPSPVSVSEFGHKKLHLRSMVTLAGKTTTKAKINNQTHTQMHKGAHILLLRPPENKSGKDNSKESKLLMNFLPG